MTNWSCCKVNYPANPSWPKPRPRPTLDVQPSTYLRTSPSLCPKMILPRTPHGRIILGQNHGALGELPQAERRTRIRLSTFKVGHSTFVFLSFAFSFPAPGEPRTLNFEHPTSKAKFRLSTFKVQRWTFNVRLPLFCLFLSRPRRTSNAQLPTSNVES